MPRPAKPQEWCEVSIRKDHRAWITVSISGRLADQGPPVKCCRGHAPMMINAYLAISDDVRVRLVK